MASDFWGRCVESEDYSIYVKNLRRIGTPAQTIADIVRSDLLANTNVLNRFPAQPEAKYWAVASDFEKTLATFDRLEKEIFVRNVLEELELPLPAAQVDAAPPLDVRFLPDSKQLRLLEIFYGYQLQIEAIGEDQQKVGFGDKEQVKSNHQLELERVVAMRALLDGEELNEFDIRNSAISADLRSSCFAGFKFTEEEFRELVQTNLYSQGPYVQFEAIWLDWRDKTMRFTTDFVDDVLSPQRALEFHRSQDTTYQDILLVTKGEGHALDVADRMYEIFGRYNKLGSSLTLKLRQHPELRTNLDQIKQKTRLEFETVVPGFLDSHPELWPDWLLDNPSQDGL